MKAQWSVLLGLTGLLTFAILPGCGAGDVNLDEGATIMPVETAKEARKFFDKAGGDYNALSETDKQAYLALFDGDQARANATWEIMLNPPNSGVPTGSN